MSSLAAVQADGFYIDPQKFNPKKGKGSANAVTGTHPLGARGSKLKSEGIIIIRFELPYDSVCTTCHHFVSHGVRFNAEKKQCGFYLSTPIWTFTMHCPNSCNTKFVIRTDPKSASYEFLEGLRRKEKEFIPDELDGLGREGGSLFLSEKVAQKREEASRDGMARLNQKVDDRVRADMEAVELEGLARAAAARRDHLVHREAWARVKGRREGEAALASLGEARGLGVPLVPLSKSEEEEDAFLAWSALDGEGRKRSDRVAAGAAGGGAGSAAAGSSWAGVESGGGGGGGGSTVVPSSLRDALLSAPLSFARQGKQPQQQQQQQQYRSRPLNPPTTLAVVVEEEGKAGVVVATGRVSHTTALAKFSASSSTTSNKPPPPALGYTRDLPPAVAAIIHAGRKRKAEEEGARARASTEGTERVSGYFRALSGAKSARVTAQAMGPVAPPSSRALSRATFR